MPSNWNRLLKRERDRERENALVLIPDVMLRKGMNQKLNGGKNLKINNEYLTCAS